MSGSSGTPTNERNVRALTDRFPGRTVRQQFKEDIMQLRRVSGFVSLLVALALLGFAAAADDHGGGSKGFDFTGIIQTLPASGMTGDWTVAGKTVHVTATTEIRQEDGVAAVGASVEVTGSLRADGSVDASRIEVERAGNAAEPEDDDFVGT